jgi:hypothetical protein
MKPAKRFATTLGSALLFAGTAWADGSIAVAPLARSETLHECGACHAPIPPQTHRMIDWRRIMADLANHMGEDATLPENIRADIEGYLLANASDGPNTRRSQ